MAIYQNPIFVGVIMTSPIWLSLVGTFLRLRYYGKNTIPGRIGISLQFLAIPILIFDILLAAFGVSVWTLAFTSLWGLMWLFAIVSMVIAILEKPDENENCTYRYGIDVFLAYFVGITFAGYTAIGVLWLLWNFFIHMISVFGGIVVLG